MVCAMVSIPKADKGTPILVHAIAAAVAQAASQEFTYLDLSGIRETDPAERKAAVAAHLHATMAELEAVIRGQRTLPGVRPAVLGRRLAEDGERFDLAASTYTPGPGFTTLIAAALADDDAAHAEAAARHPSTSPDSH